MTTAADAATATDHHHLPTPHRIRWHRLLPVGAIHLGCLGVIWVGWSWAAVAAALALYLLRMFFITAFYHRYFSHRTFRTSRPVQFLFAFLATTAAQRGPLWWAAHHREHHRHADDHPDPHSPTLKGLIWSHMAWVYSDKGAQTRTDLVPDLARLPELRWLNRWHIAGPLALIAFCLLLGWAIDALFPALGTSPLQMLVWGFFVSTTALYHATFTINSLAHTIGSRRYDTADDSRNNWFLALITLGEGWHNNHHFNPGSTRQGFYWWEIDLAYYGLWLLERARLIRDLRPVAQRAYDREHPLRVRPGA